MLSIGIDISKGKLDCCIAGKCIQIANDEKAIKQLFKSVTRDSQIVMEATGKYHRLAHRTLELMGFVVMVINPYQSKHFANAMNLKCKTDKVDAQMLMCYAKRMEFIPTPCASPKEQALQELTRYLDDLKELKIELEARIRDNTGFIKSSLERNLKSIKRELEKTREKLKKEISESEPHTRKLNLLLSIPGVGETSAIYLISCLRELGQVNKREIASLSGLAPMNHDSGNSQGKRRVMGGRRDIRKRLYMPVLASATLNNNPRLRELYLRLVATNKPKKVALIACMRKLVIWANAVIATDKPWDDSYA